MSKEWHENIPENGLLATNRHGVLVIVNNKKGDIVIYNNSIETYPENLTPLTSDEIWKFMPWQDVNSAPRDGSEILLLFENGVIATNCADYSFWTEKRILYPIKWMPLPTDHN